MNSNDVSTLTKGFLEVESQYGNSTLKLAGLQEQPCDSSDSVDGRIYLSSPAKSYDLYSMVPIISQNNFELVLNGVKILTDDNKEVFAPVHVMCCQKGQYICYEVKFLAGSSWEGNSVTFSSPVTYGLGKIIDYLPDSLFDCEEFLRGLIPGCHDELHTLLIDLTSELCLVHEYTEDVGECYNYISDLYKIAASERASYQPQEPRPFTQCSQSSQYIADGKWIATGEDGTVKLSPEGDAVGYLTGLCIDATLATNSDCVISLSHALHTGNETVIEFQSPNNMPESIPLAALQAIEYIRLNYSDTQDLGSALVIGCTGWLLREDYDGSLEGMYLETADLYEKHTGEQLKGIRTADGYGYDWDESYQ